MDITTARGDALTLAIDPASITFELMDGAMTLKDNSLEVQLFQAKSNVHPGLLVYAWVPRDRMLVQPIARTN